MQEVAEEVTSKAREEGAFGSSTDRYLTSARLQSKLPDGAEWQTVRIRYYRQARSHLLHNLSVADTCTVLVCSVLWRARMPRCVIEAC